MGQDIGKEDLGGYRIHARGSGVVDNEADSEAEAIEQTQRFLSYLPQNVNRLPQRQDCDDDPERREEALLSSIPRQRRRVYKARRILEMVLDQGSIFEIGRHNGPSAISCLGRLNGYPVGVLANDPYHYGGAMTLRSSQKIETFVDLCDTFHLPLVSFFDQPGILIGREAEEAGTVRAAVRAIAAIEQSIMPWCTIVVRRAFGVAGAAHGRLSGINMRYAWPSASWGSIPIEGGVAAAYRRELAEHPDPETRLAELENYFARFTSPFRTAERFGINDVIDPRETRSLLCEWVEDAYEQLPEMVGPRRRTMRR
jgi:acetyl-CoA carboxylase carboxyltransferase component